MKSSILPGHGDKCGPFRLPLHIKRAKTFRTRKNFPVSNADALTGFLALCETGALSPRPECPKGAKDKVKRPKGPPARNQGPEGH